MAEHDGDASVIAAPRAGGDRPWQPPLSGYALCRTADLDVFREHLCSMFYPAAVDTLRRNARLERSWLSGVRLTHLTIGTVRFGTETTVEPGPLGAYHVNLALAGRVESICGTQRVATSGAQGAVFTPDPPTNLPRWSDDAAQLCIKIRRRSLEAELTALLGHAVTAPVDFRLALDLSAPATQSWLATLRLLMTELDRPGSPLRTSPAHAEHLERLVMSGLVLAQLNAYTDELARPARPIRPRTVDLVVAFIHEHAERPLTLSDLAAHAGVGGRRLQQGFREHVGMSPMEYVRRVRLDRARRELTETEDTVTEIAFRCGFLHPGRFARAYREQFGVTPTEARRQR